MIILDIAELNVKLMKKQHLPFFFTSCGAVPDVPIIQCLWQYIN